LNYASANGISFDWAWFHKAPTGIDPYAWQMLYLDDKVDAPIWQITSLIFFVMTLVMLASNFIFIFINIAGCFRRGLKRFWLYALFSPIYWIFISIGAWKGFIQLFTNPFYWEKTDHGFTGDNAQAENLPVKKNEKNKMEEGDTQELTPDIQA
jgi:hypothetical protein